jgi:hypothetical protein
MRRTLELADPRTLDKIARVRAWVRAHVWPLIAASRPGSRAAASARCGTVGTLRAAISDLQRAFQPRELLRVILHDALKSCLL